MFKSLAKISIFSYFWAKIKGACFKVRVNCLICMKLTFNMKFQYSLLIVFAFALLGVNKSFSQGDRCSTIQPFCAGDSQLVFPNSNPQSGGRPRAESGPSYGCLVTQPYPVWYFLKVGEAGTLVFDIVQSENPDGSGTLIDVDFIVWGPFNADEEYCSAASLSTAKIVDCSYEVDAIERMSIPNARVDDIYIVLITNYDEKPGYISLQQINTSSGGSTDCSIVGSALGPDQKVCGSDPVVLDATNSQASEYSWALFNEATGNFETLPGETESTLTVSETGNYQVTVKSEFFGSEESDQVLVEFFEIPQANSPSAVIGCSGNGDVVLDLTQANSEIIGSQAGSFTVNFFLNEAAYQNNTPIQDPENFSGDVQSVLALIIDDLSGCESSLITVPLEIAQFPSLEWKEISPVCIDLNANLVSRISLGRDLGPGYTYNWSEPNDPDGDGIQNPVLNLDQFPSQRIISLVVTNEETGCARTFNTEIVVFSPPSGVNIEISGNDFEDGGYRVTATAVGAIGNPGVYEYRLNDGPWQFDNIFTRVPGGTHRITAREINGCGSATSAPFRLIGYPRFFTPNNDGYNDTWNIIAGDGILVTKIIIYDRYGKLIKQVNPGSAGWDGSFNNRPMPADDYWFVVDYTDSSAEGVQQFKGHFTLKQ